MTNGAGGQPFVIESPSSLNPVLAAMCFFSSRRRHTGFDCDWGSDVGPSDLGCGPRWDREGGARRFRKAGGGSLQRVVHPRLVGVQVREGRDAIPRGDTHDAREGATRWV